MTIIAYLHDCHCRYDERSNVQKKMSFRQSTRSCKGPTRPRYLDTVPNDVVHFLPVVAFVGTIGSSAGGQ